MPRFVRCIETPPSPKPKPARGFDTPPKTRHSTAAPTWASSIRFFNTLAAVRGSVNIRLPFDAGANPLRRACGSVKTTRGGLRYGRGAEMLLNDERDSAAQPRLEGIVGGENPSGVLQGAAVGHRLLDDRSNA